MTNKWILLLLLFGASVVAQEPAAPACEDCHDQAKASANPHIAADSCMTCHGDGTEHIANGGDKTKVSVPRGRTGSDDTCLLCHEQTRGAMHANTGQVNCLTCHSIHSRSAHLVSKPQLALCGSCHTQSASMRHKPYAHRLDRGGMACSTCHDSHARRKSGEAKCVSCHTEKRGPFVFAHGGAELGECTTCHEAHGSSNPKRLVRATVQQVCLECHSPTATATLGSQPPSFHNLSLPRYQNCTTCHTAVHGSNRDPQLLK